MGAFKASDIRGVWKKDFDESTVYKIGFFLPKLLKTNHIVVGRDVRISSPIIHDWLIRGITDAGADVWDLGRSTTPMVYFATVFLKANASVEITASHNPAKYNGLKISGKGALPISGETGLKELEKMTIEDEIVISKQKGNVKDYSYIKDEYIKFLKTFSEDFNDIAMTIDCSSGMANLIIKEILGPSQHYINDTFDGTFPSHEPNPLIQDNCAQLIDEVKKNNSELGIIYDGDADRVVFVDDKARWIQPDYITAVIGYYYTNKGQTGNIVADVRTSKSTTEYLEKLGWNTSICKVGHAFAKLKIREIDGIFGGELAGHYYFKEFFNCDSGILASLLVLKVLKELKREGKTLSSLIDEIVAYENSSEVNFELDDKDLAIKELYETYAPSANTIYDICGYRIEYDSWWFCVRKSNTEPLLRVVCEAKSKELLNQKLSEITTIIKKYK